MEFITAKSRNSSKIASVAQNCLEPILGFIDGNEYPRLEDDCESSDQQLDGKEEEMHQQSHYVEELKEQLLSQGELLTNVQRKYEYLQTAIMRMQQENKDVKNEIGQIAHTLRGLENNCEKMSEEIKTKETDIDSSNDELFQKEVVLNTTSCELEQLKDVSAYRSSKYSEMLCYLLSDISELGQVICTNSAGDMKMNYPDSAEEIENQIAIARQHIKKMISEAENIAQKYQNLEMQKMNSDKIILQYEKDNLQHEERLQTLLKAMEEAENEKRTLAEQVDSLRKEFSEFKVDKDRRPADVGEKQTTAQARAEFAKQINELCVVHAQAIAEFQHNLFLKQKSISKLKGLRALKLKQDEAKLHDVILENERRKRAHKDLTEIEYSIIKEL